MISAKREESMLYPYKRFRLFFRKSPTLFILSSTVTFVLFLPVLYLFLRAYEPDIHIPSFIFQENTLKILLNTLLLALAVTFSATMIALPLAWLTVKTDLPWRRFWTVLTMLPLSIPSLIGGFTFISALGQGGIVHSFLQNIFHLQKFPNIYGFTGAWLVLSLLCYPYILLSVRGTLQKMGHSQEEAALILGKSRWQVFKKITLPRLRPSISAGALLVTLYTFSDFAAVSLLQFNTFTRAIYLEYQGSFNRSYAAILSLLLVFITTIIISLEIWTRKKARYFNTGSCSERVADTIPLGKWKVPAFLFCSIIVLFSVVLPFSVCSYWIIRGLLQGEPLIIRWKAVLNSFFVSLYTALLIIPITIPTAFFTSRYQTMSSKLIEKTSYITFALPGIVIALSLVFFGANYLPHFYQTLPLLIFAYIILFFPQMLGCLRSSLLHVNPHIEQSAFTLGCSRQKVLFRLTLPLIKPGIVAGSALVFLTAMKELPATLLLAPIGFRTLTTEIWNATTEAFYVRAAFPSLLLMILSSLSLGVMYYQDKRDENFF